MNTEDNLEIFLNNINKEDENEDLDEKNNGNDNIQECCSEATHDGSCDLCLIQV